MITQHNVDESESVSKNESNDHDNYNNEEIEESEEESNENSFPSNSNEENNNNQMSYQPTRGVLILKDNVTQSKRSRFNRSRLTESHTSQLKKKAVVSNLSDISDEEEITKNLRQILDKFISTGRRNLYLQVILTVLTTINFLFYIICTYIHELFYYLNYTDLGLCIIFLLEYLFNLILSHHYGSYIISIESIVNLISIVPFIFFFLSDDYMSNPWYIFLNICRVSRVLRIFRIFKQFKNEENNVTGQIMMIVTTLLQVILCSASIVQLVEYSTIEIKLKITFNTFSNNNLKMRTQFHHYLYFIVVTISTVGYGDIYPLTVFGKFVFMFIVLFIIVLIPYQINDLIQLMSSQSEYARHTYKASREIPHIILTGDISLDSLRTFCQELFHIDHGTQFRHAVIICSDVPTREMEIFLNEKLHENFIFYLQGNPLNEKDLLRADAPKAKACIIFNNKNSKDPHTGDHQSLFLAIFVKKFVYNYNQYIIQSITDLPDFFFHLNPHFRLCMQLNKPESSCHYYNTLQHMYKKRMKQDQLIVIESIKMNLLSKSCLTPGIMALITNLVMSAGSFDDNNEAEWMKEYVEGRGHEIYRIPLLHYYKTMNFMEVVKNIYNQGQAIAFALEIEVGGSSIVKLNPTSNVKLNDLIIQVKESCDKTKDYQTGDNDNVCSKKENSLIQDSEDNSSRKMNNNSDNTTNVRLFAYLICSDKSVADSISNKEREQLSTDLNANTQLKEFPNANLNSNPNPNPNVNVNGNVNANSNQNNNGGFIHSMLNPISHLSTGNKSKDNPLKAAILSNLQYYSNNNQSDSDSDDNEESDNDDIIQFGSSDLDYNKNDFYFNFDSDHYIKNNIEIMHHSIKDREDITNHIIICGLHPALVHFILPLRAKYLQEDALKWIVILAPSLPQHLFESFTKFPRIIFIQGSPLLPENLFRANIVNADKAVILSSGESKVIKNQMFMDNINTSFNSEEQMLDAETIFIYKAIKKCNKNIQIMTELVCTSNIEYLLNTSNLEKLFFKQNSSPQYEFTPIYASGEVFTPSIIDRITCQSYYNPHIITIINLILGGDHSFISKKCRKLDDQIKLGGSNLYLVKIPDAYVNESFGEFFYFLIHHHHSIGIALYRKNIIEDFYYVYTNPKKTTLLRDCDFVFVLSNGNTILDLIDERPLGGEVIEGNKTNSSDSEESLIEEDDMVESGNLKDNFNLLDNNNMVQPRKRGNELKKTFASPRKRPSTNKMSHHESILTQLNKLEQKKKLIETSKHTEIERLQERLSIINIDLKNLKNSFDSLPHFIDDMIDKELETELMVYLSKS